MSFEEASSPDVHRLDCAELGVWRVDLLPCSWTIEVWKRERNNDNAKYKNIWNTFSKLLIVKYKIILWPENILNNESFSEVFLQSIPISFEFSYSLPRITKIQNKHALFTTKQCLWFSKTEAYHLFSKNEMVNQNLNPNQRK